jgi:uncharacterized protein|tara:strand:+ start:190 stop:366 length:177 start_codon:yes stop_codon:yes gene_type:complete
MTKSPCVGICNMSLEGNFCKGCGRSIDQITHWTDYNDKQKKEIIENIKKVNFKKNEFN